MALRVLLGAALLLGAAATGLHFLRNADERRKEDALARTRLELEEPRHALEERVAKLEEWREESGRLRAGVDTALVALKEEAAKLRSSLDAVLATLERLGPRVEAADSRTSGEKALLESALSRNESLAGEVSGSTGKLISLEKHWAEIQTAQASLEAKVDRLSLELKELAAPSRPAAPSPASGDSGAGPPGNPVEKPARPPAPSRIEARVELVQNGMVIITAGTRAGVEKGREFEIRREGKVVARVRVTHLYPELSGARILPAPPAGAIERGDVAVAER